jgi:hypothetical protein
MIQRLSPRGMRLVASDQPEPLQTPQEPFHGPLGTVTHSFSEHETRKLARALEFTLLLGHSTGHDVSVHEQLRDRLLRSIGEQPDVIVPVDSRPAHELSRAQELAADGMSAKYGRSHWRLQADGSAVVTGLLDDIEMEEVCLERDGTERWRS